MAVIAGNLVLSGTGELQNVHLENLSTDPVSPSEGRIWSNTTSHVVKTFNGTVVKQLATGTVDTDALLTEVNAIETGAGLNTDGTLTAPTGTNYLGSITTLKGGLTALDTQVKSAADAADAANTNANGRVSKSGDTMTGSLVIPTGSHVTITDAPSNATDGTNKSYVDGVASGMYWAKAIISPNVITQTATPPGSPVEGDAYIVASSPTGAWSAITPGTLVEWQAGSWVSVKLLAADDRVGVSIESATLATGDFASQDDKIATVVGTAGAFTFTFAAVTDKTALSVLGASSSFHFGHSYVYATGTGWTEFQGPAATGAGTGLSWAGNILNVNLGAGVGQLPTDEVGIDVYANGGLFTTVDGSASSTATAAQLSIKLNGSSLNLSSSGLKIADAGVSETQLATSVAGNGLTGGAGTALAVGAGTGISVSVDAVAFDTTFGDGRYLTLSGGTLTGALTLAADPSADLQAATKQYVDNGTYVFTAGSTNTSHVITHNLGKQFCDVTVYDYATNQVIIPDTITADSTTQMTITVNPTLRIIAVIRR